MPPADRIRSRKGSITVNSPTPDRKPLTDDIGPVLSRPPAEHVLVRGVTDGFGHFESHHEAEYSAYKITEDTAVTK